MVELLSSTQKRSHRNCATSLSLDDSRVATGGKDSCVLLYNCAPGELSNSGRFEISSVSSIRTKVLSVDLSGDRVVCGTSCGQLHILDVRSSGSDRILAHNAQISCVRWLDSARDAVCSTSLDGKVKVWDLRHTAIPLHELIGHTAGVNCCDSLPNCQSQDELSINFGDYYERVLTVGSDRTARLWNLNSGTHLVFKVPATLSQNAECCCILLKRPHYIFAVGLDSEYILVFSLKLSKHIGSLSLGGPGVWVNCMRNWGSYLLVGTNVGKLLFVRFDFNDNYSSCTLTVECSFDYRGSVNDISFEEVGGELCVYLALGTEMRLGRWGAIEVPNDAKPQNLINQSLFAL
ncbi:U3 snoRNP-associated protein-like YAOH [Babesia sp. Xinjiang]|uniref:U3 snoRNP-associated protein-like YAOH n=1 Tax=Babesia sp. Xinjiang TaxID=462227 RepID=UPI000A22D32C|nr:U3 snoRNP-associated protein-like YAOH [Babesia sp. Xinjiang]ORM41049.1 U3 snoRNP-associated protein-like YAOH [Babesia sp. Xinjiang]